MNAETLLALLNPVMSTVFAAVFLTLWVYHPVSGYLRTLALCYAGLAVGFTLLVIALPVGLVHTRALANLIVLLSGLCLSLATFQRCNLTFPHALYWAFAAATYAPFLWFLYVNPDVVARIHVINGGVALMMLTCAMLTYRGIRTIADRVLFCLLLAYAALSVARPLLTLPHDNLAPDASIALSSYWMVFSFTHAVISLLMVFALTTGFALDMLRELRATTFTDPLSGLMNRRGFELAAHEAIATARARNLPVSIILCDLDHFKSINDTYGHHVGDAVIELFAKTLRETTAGQHVVGRIGGEEFAIVMGGADKRVAELVAHGARLGFSVAPTPGRELGAARRLTASFGVAEMHNRESYTDLLGRADAALYQAKAEGRDAVCVAPEPALYRGDAASALVY